MPNLIAWIGRAQIGMLQPFLKWPHTRIPDVRDGRRAEAATCIAGCRLNKQTFERPLLQAPAISHDIESHSTCHTQIFARNAGMEIANLGQ